MIVRVHKNNNYSIVDNTVFNDPRLSLKAKGLAGYLFTKPDDWSINAKNISYYSTDGIDSIWTGLKELEEHGYLVRRRVNDPQTGYLVWDYDLYETPHHAQHLIELRSALERAKANKPPIKHRKSPNRDNPCTVYPRVVEPCMDYPRVDKPRVDNPILLITDQPITDQPITDQLNTDQPNTQPDDDDDHLPLLQEKIPMRARVTRAYLRHALRNKAGEYAYQHDYIYRLELSEETLAIALRDAAHRATYQAIISGWDDREQWLSNLSTRDLQRVIDWCYRILFGGNTDEIRNPVALIKAKHKTTPELGEWHNGQRAWFHEICLTNRYTRYEDALKQGEMYTVRY